MLAWCVRVHGESDAMQSAGMIQFEADGDTAKV
jgi:hypothetical protein